MILVLPSVADNFYSMPVLTTCMVSTSKSSIIFDLTADFKYK